MSEVQKFECKIEGQDNHDELIKRPMLRIYYGELVLVVKEEIKYVAIYNRIANGPHPMSWDYQNSSKWRDGQIVAEGKGVFGAGNGISYVRFIGNEIKFGVIWGGWPTEPIVFNKFRGMLQDTFKYHCQRNDNLNHKFD